MKITALIVGSSLLGPLRRAEEELNRRHAAGLTVRAYNLGAPLDEEMLERLSRLNPHSARSLVARLLEAEGRGFWKAEAAVVEKLRDAFADLEDRIEGVA